MSSHTMLSREDPVDTVDPKQDPEKQRRESTSSTYVTLYNADAPIPNMFTKERFGLYAHYAAVGFVLGLTGATTTKACKYIYKGPLMLCNNAGYIVFLPWNFKIVIAFFTDLFWPFGIRRKVYMLTGWLCTIALLLFVAIQYRSLDAHTFVYVITATQFFVNLANVPADGLSVEYARWEHPAERGKVLVTGQAFRFASGILVNFFLAFFVNGEELNPPNTVLRWDQMWGWGLTLRQFYCIIIVGLLACVASMAMLRELEVEGVPRRNFRQLSEGIWDTLRNKAAFNLIVFVLCKKAIARVIPQSSGILQYQLIRLPNLQLGFENMFSYVYRCLAVFTFRNHLLNVDWRKLEYFVESFVIFYQIAWILALHNLFGLRNGWFTVFLGITETYVGTLNQMTGSVAIVEVTQHGMEATTYQLIISMSNIGVTLSSILGTQFAKLFDLAVIPTSSFKLFDEAYGPRIHSYYTLGTMALSAAGVLFSTRFLPRTRAMCAKWKREGELSGRGTFYAIGSILLFVGGTVYTLMVSIYSLDKERACHAFVGGSGCDVDDL